MQAYEGYLENGRFYPIGKQVHLAGRRRVVVTVVDEPIKPPSITCDNSNDEVDTKKAHTMAQGAA